jgi:cell division transport system permease protein
MSSIENSFQAHTEYGYHREKLVDYWQKREQLPTMSTLSLPYYFIQRSWKVVENSRLHALVGIIAVAFAFFLLCALLLLITNIEHGLQRAGGRFDYTFYLVDAPDDAVSELVANMDGRQSVQSVRYITKDQALSFIRTETEGFGELFSLFEGQNPLPASIDVTFRHTADESAIALAVEEFGKQNIVREVVSGKDWVTGVERVVRSLRIYSVLAFALVCAILTLLIGGVMKLTVYNRRDETAILRLMGAEESVVRFPFFMAGVFQAGMGALVGLLFLWLIHLFLQAEFARVLSFEGFEMTLVFLRPIEVFLVLSASLLVGGVASYIALGDVEREERGYFS